MKQRLLSNIITEVRSIINYYSNPNKDTMFDRWRLRKSSREMGPSGAPMPMPLNLLFSETKSSAQKQKEINKKIL